MLVSFIIIAYNAEKFLDKSLESLKKQDYPHKNIEVILVDSISTDGTRKVFEKFKKENENYSINRTATAFPTMRTMRVSPSPPISIGE